MRSTECGRRCRASHEFQQLGKFIMSRSSSACHDSSREAVDMRIKRHPSLFLQLFLLFFFEQMMDKALCHPQLGDSLIWTIFEQLFV